MKEEIIKIIAGVAEVPEESINLKTNLIADLDLESLDLVTLVSEIENKYQLEIPDKEIKKIQTVEDIVKNNALGKAEVYPATINLASTGQNENNLTFTIMKHDDLNIQGVKDMYPEGKDVTTESGLSGYLRYSKDNKSAVLVVELNDKWTLGIQNSGKNVSEMSIDNLASALAELIQK